MDDGEVDRTVTFLDGDRVVEGAQRVLRRRVTGKTGERQEGGHAADGDDVAVALCAKSPECRERAGERAHEVGRDRSLVARDRYISGESGLDDSALFTTTSRTPNRAALSSSAASQPFSDV